MPKASVANQAVRLQDIPNIGPSLAADLMSVGITTPSQVQAMDPWAVYEQLRSPMGQRHDPCVLDVFLAAHDFMNGGVSQPWWHFTPSRKRMLTTRSQIQKGSLSCSKKS